jgi:hypothetical protein
MRTHALSRFVSGAVALLVLVGPRARPAFAQGRFELLSRDSLAQMPEVTIDTIRDRQTSTCYAVFIGGQAPSVGPLTAPAGAVPPAVVEDWGPIVATTGVRPGESTSDVHSWATLPGASTYPGLPTGGWELLAESVRRALVDPSTVKALSAPLHDALTGLDERLRRLEMLLQKVDASRTVAAWRVSCNAATDKR